jgi:hypothetical protein
MLEFNKYVVLVRDDIVYTDTDSAALLPNPLTNVGNNLGEMKLEYKIKEGFFISPKLYYNLTNENEEIIKPTHRVVENGNKILNKNDSTTQLFSGLNGTVGPKSFKTWSYKNFSINKQLAAGTLQGVNTWLPSLYPVT